MKHFFISLIVLTLLSCQPKDLPTVFELSDETVLVKVSHQTTQSEMKTIAEQLKEKQFQMDFTGSEFYENDKLKNLKLIIITPQGNKGITKADIVALQFKYFGFLYKKEGNPSFKIGEI
jgi:superfamily I DNA and RNA helicase